MCGTSLPSFALLVESSARLPWQSNYAATANLEEDDAAGSPRALMSVVEMSAADDSGRKGRSCRELQWDRTSRDAAGVNPVIKGARRIARRLRSARSRPATPVEATPQNAVAALGLATLAMFVGLLLGVGGAVFFRSNFQELVGDTPLVVLAAAGAGVCAGIGMGGCTGALGARAFGLEERWLQHALPNRPGILVVLRAAALDSDVVVTGILVFALLLIIAVAVSVAAAASGMGGFALGWIVGLLLGANSSLFLVGFFVPVGASVGIGLCCLIGAIMGALVGARFWIRYFQDNLLYHPRRYGNASFSYETQTFGDCIYQPQKISYSFPGPVCGHFDQTAVLLQPQSSDISGLWVLFGGNAFLASDWLNFVQSVVQEGGSQARAAYLLLDPPGYGWNAGRPSPASVLAASRQAVRVAVQACASGGGPPPQVHLLGHSLGAAEASQLACGLAREGASLGTLMLSAPFLSIPHMAERIVGGALPSALRPVLSPIIHLAVPHRWDNVSNVPAAAKAGWRLCIVHGTMDPMCPVKHGRELHRLATAAVSSSSRSFSDSRSTNPSFTEIAKAGHNDVLQIGMLDYAHLMRLAVDEGTTA